MRKQIRYACVLLCLLPLFAPAQSLPPRIFEALSWRLIGPFRGGRAEAATGVPGDPNTFYFGAVGGGIWKTTDAGTAWTPVFDAQPVASIGAIEVAPSNPNIVYAGTGETDLRSDIAIGNGIYKSTDAGRTWACVGLRETRQIGRILIDPSNPDVVYVAALGHAYGPNPERGIFRTRDGGATWQKVLYKDPDTGAIDLAWDAADPRTLYATLWNVRRPARVQYAPIEGPGSGLYKSVDGGDTWKELHGSGLPEQPWHRAGVAVAPGARGSRVYLLVDAPDGGLFRSDDAGQTWSRPGRDPRILSRGWYFGRITVDPHNPDTVYLPNVALYRTSDGGRSFDIVRGAPGGDDYHYLWIDPASSRRMILATDQGTTISVDGGVTWTTWYNQPTAQIYRVVAGNRFPYHVYATQQDSGSVALPSRTDHGKITEADRYSIGGSESGYVAPDPHDPDIVYLAGPYGELTRFDKRTSQGQNITPWPDFQFQPDVSKQKYRYPWTPVLTFSPLERNILFYGAQVLFRTADGGLNWQEISRDLTGPSGQGVIYTVAPSPLRAGVIWAGSDTGLVHVTVDAGKSWTDVTPPGITPWSKITRIEASHFDAAVAYAAVDRHRLEDNRPYIYRTGDFGRTWTSIAAGIAENAFLNAVREDPVRRGLLYAATETGVYLSLDDGARWQSLQFNLPTCSVRDLDIHDGDLIAATHGRSIWIMDDIAPLRQATAQVANAAAWLYRPARAVRVSSEEFLGTPLPPEIPQARNPPAGALIDYYLAASQDSVTLEILDSGGRLVRRYTSSEPPAPPAHPGAVAKVWIETPPRLSAAAGMHRFVWDLRYPAPGASGPLVLPGKYQVRLTAGGHTYRQALDVILDPRSRASAADLAAQLDLALKAVRALERTAAMLDQNRQAPASSQASAVRVAVERIDAQLRHVMEVAESADRRPPSQAVTLYRKAAGELDIQAARWKAAR